MIRNYKNIIRLEVVARALKELTEKVVFVGGAVVDLYVDDPARVEVGPTDDIDVVIEIFNRTTHADLKNKLRSIGFQNDVDSGVICRYKYHEIIVDIMPNDERILGFANSWFKDRLKHSVDFELKRKSENSNISPFLFLSIKIRDVEIKRGKRLSRK